MMNDQTQESTHRPQHHQTITIGPPGKVGEGVHSHYVYSIESTVFTKEKACQDRRYSDFLWLHSQLLRDFPGAIVPPLPEKVVSALQGTAFLEKRRAGLEFYLVEILMHPICRDAKCFMQFLTASSVSLTTIKGMGREAMSTLESKTSSLSSWWGKTYQRITENEKVQSFAAKTGTEWGRRGSQHKTEADIELESVSKYITNLLALLKNFGARLEQLISDGEHMSMSLAELSSSLGVLAEAESHELDQSRDLHAIEPILRQKAMQQHLDFRTLGEQVQYLTKFVIAAKEAIATREDRRFAYQAAVLHLEKCLEKEDHQLPHEQVIPQADRAVEESKLELEQVHERVMAELKRFKTRKTKDLQTYLSQFAELQVVHNTEMVKVLAMTLPHVQYVREEEEEKKKQAQRGIPPREYSTKDPLTLNPNVENIECGKVTPALPAAPAVMSSDKIESSFADVAL